MSQFEINFDEIASALDNAAQDAAAPATAQENSVPTYPSETRSSPVVVLVMGMAGAGKTALMHRLNLYTVEKGIKGYFINLDPAVKSTPFGANIDIRDTVNYKEVMSQYGLGPNGAILTSLNLFATKFDQVVQLLDKRADTLDYIFIDTPGQIEAFTWSAGGMIIQELLASSFPTTVIYVGDTVRCTSPTTFMSNMLYSCSVLYKSRLPMIIAFNKVDVVPSSVVEEWMCDFESYMSALDSSTEDYMKSFNRSLNLVMDEFYSHIKRVGVSAATGQGIDDLFRKIDETVIDFKTIYLPDLQARVLRQKSKDLIRQEMDLQRLHEDIVANQGDKVVFSVKK